MLRIPNFSPNLDELDHQIAEITQQWYTFKCTLITPMYGGGTKSAIVDTKIPIRASAIRGQLRFWWRLLAKHKWRLSNISQAETRLWGGMCEGDEEGGASGVLLRVVNMPSQKEVEGKLVEYYEYQQSGIKYALFASDNAQDKETNPHKLLDPNEVTWDLQLCFLPMVNANARQQVIETLRWWANFGGVGARTRRGLGAFYIGQCPEGFEQVGKPLSADEVKEAKCQLRQRSSTPNAMRAWDTALTKLADFRQKVNVGRNPSASGKPAGRSRFPEPDALRRIRGRGYDKRHEPKHKSGNIFPRALFGLPIVFHSRAEDALKATANPNFGERLASPLILRPVFVDNKDTRPQFSATALLLPYEHLLDKQVEIDDKSYPIWQADKAQYITPIRENGGGDPLSAFLNFFVK